MKSCSISIRLLWLGATLRIAGVWGSESEDSLNIAHLRRGKHRIALEAGTIGEINQIEKTAQIKQAANSQVPASQPTGFSPRYYYGNGGQTRYYQNVQPPIYYPVYEETPKETFAPVVSDAYTYPPTISYGTTGPTMALTEYSSPTMGPTTADTEVPTFTPTIITEVPTLSPTIITEVPTFTPTIVTEVPTFTPTIVTEVPTFTPTITTDGPTVSPTTESPTITITPSTSALPSLDPNTVIFTLQDVAGVCNGAPNGIGCANLDPEDEAAGNPNDIVNCYNAADFGVPIPFSLDAVRVWIGDSTVLTPDLQVNIWVGNREGGGPIASRLLYSEEVFGYTFGENLFELSMGRMIYASDFCVGVTARSSNAGLRIVTTDSGGTGESSYLRSPECGVEEFTSLLNAGLQNDFCIEAIVSMEGFR